MSSYRFIFLILINLFFHSDVFAWPWTLNYVPLTDTYRPYDITLTGFFTGYTEFDYKDPLTGTKIKQSFKDTSSQFFAINMGLPTLRLGKFNINWDIGYNRQEPDSPFYDENWFDMKIRFLDDAQFSKWQPSIALGTWYLGGRFDLDAYENYDFFGKYRHPNASNPSIYLAASKYLYIPYFLTEISFSYMWNNYGIAEEDVIGAGFYTVLGTQKLWFTGDYYGGDFGQFGVGLFAALTDEIWLQAIYFIPKNKDYTAQVAGTSVRIRDYNSPSLWFGLYFTLPGKWWLRR